MEVLNNGYESPTFNSKIIKEYRTGINIPGEGIDYKWRPNDAKDDSKFWSNLEFNKYGNGMDTSQFRTRAYLESRGDNNVFVHAPSHSDLRMTTRPELTLSGVSEFLQTEQKERLFSQSEAEKLAIDHYIKIKK